MLSWKLNMLQVPQKEFQLLNVLCTGVRVLITMLPACAQVREAYCGKDGILSADGAMAALTGTPAARYTHRA